MPLGCKAGRERGEGNDVSDLQASEESYDEDYRAAGRRWWSALVGIEVSLFIILVGAGSMSISPHDERLPLERLADRPAILAGLVRFNSVSGETGVDAWVVLGLLATLGIGTTVAMSSALDRTERAHEARRGATTNSPSDVFRLRFAEIGQRATLLVTLVPLLLCHLVAVAAVAQIAATSTGERGGATLTLVFVLFMALFFLVECVRLAAPFKSPVLVRPWGVDKAIRQRLGKKIRAATRRGAARRLLSSVGMAIVVVTILAWLIWPSMLSAGSPEEREPVAVFIAGVLLLGVLSAMMGRLVIDSLLDSTGSRVASVAGSMLLFIAGVLACFGAIFGTIPDMGAWGRGEWKLWVVLLLYVLVVVVLLLRLLGRAGIGPDSDLALHRIFLARYPRYAAKHRKVWWVVPAAVAVQLVLASVGALGMSGGVFEVDLLPRAALLAVIGIAGSVLCVIACGEFALDDPETAAPQERALRHLDRILHMAIFVVVALTLLGSQIFLGGWRLLVVVWAAGVLLTLAPAIRQFLGYERPWVKWLRPLWVLADHVLALRISSARRLIARRIAPDEEWGNAEVFRWLREVDEAAKAPEPSDHSQP